MMANVLKIALFKKEEKIACLITAFYNITIEEDMIFSAIEKK
jgi:hypothetical protein